jgi:hypothetical protein
MPFSGETVALSGIYNVVHAKHPKQNAKRAFLTGTKFPNCDHCGRCEYVLLKAAPGLHEDPDLQPQGRKRQKAVVLCIGADEGLMSARRLILEKAGHRVFQASSSSAAARHCAEHAIEVAVIGQAVPAPEKQRAFDLIREKCPQAKILELHDRATRPFLKSADRRLAVSEWPGELPDVVSELVASRARKIRSGAG